MRALLNGADAEIDDRVASLLLYGFGVYTSFSVLDGRTIGWSRHLDRLVDSASAFLGVGLSREDISNNVLQFLAKQSTTSATTVRVTVYPDGFSLADPGTSTNAVILVTGRSGSSVTSSSLRLMLDDCRRPYANYKLTNIAAAMRLRADAKMAGYDDALMHDAGHVTEGPTWNIFFVTQSGDIVTPSADSNILPGITRSLIIHVGTDQITERSVHVEELSTFKAAFVTNAVIGSKPVETINDIQYDVSHPSIGVVQRAYSSLVPEIIN